MITPAIVKQKEIVSVIRQRSELEFFHLVYLCWEETRRFGFEGIRTRQWNNVLWRLKDWKEPSSRAAIENDMCNCRRINHAKSCPVRGFREAIAEDNAA